jgi:hypothetical protein
VGKRDGTAIREGLDDEVGVPGKGVWQTRTGRKSKDVTLHSSIIVEHIQLVSHSHRREGGTGVGVGVGTHSDRPWDRRTKRWASRSAIAGRGKGREGWWVGG